MSQRHSIREAEHLYAVIAARQIGHVVLDADGHRVAQSPEAVEQRRLSRIPHIEYHHVLAPTHGKEGAALGHRHQVAVAIGHKGAQGRQPEDIRGIDQVQRETRRLVAGVAPGLSREKTDAVLDLDTAQIAAFRIGEKADDPLKMYLADICTLSLNLSGNCGISIPCGFANGLPIGLQIMGNAYDEETILRVAFAYEQATDWHLRSPAL